MHQHVLLSQAVWGFEQHTAKWTCTLHMQHGNTWASIHAPNMQHQPGTRTSHIAHHRVRSSQDRCQISYTPPTIAIETGQGRSENRKKQTTNKQKQQPITCASKTHHRRELRSSWPVPITPAGTSPLGAPCHHAALTVQSAIKSFDTRCDFPRSCGDKRRVAFVRRVERRGRCLVSSPSSVSGDDDLGEVRGDDGSG